MSREWFDHHAGSVFSAMRDKDPEMFATLGNLDVVRAMERWIEVYPDDFPRRGLTEVSDIGAIKPKQRPA